MWERFSYYGMRALFVMYLNDELLQPGRYENVVGMGMFVGESGIYGTTDTKETRQAASSHLYGLYTALVYFTPLLGGILADQKLGQRFAVVIGGVLMAIGHFALAFQSLFVVGLLFLVLGNGLFKPNISTQVGRLYAEGDPRRDAAFSIFYGGINVGAMLSPLVCGTLGENVSFEAGFAAAGVGMCLGLTVYVCGLPWLAPDQG